MSQHPQSFNPFLHLGGFISEVRANVGDDLRFNLDRLLGVFDDPDKAGLEGGREFRQKVSESPILQALTTEVKEHPTRLALDLTTVGDVRFTIKGLFSGDPLTFGAGAVGLALGPFASGRGVREMAQSLGVAVKEGFDKRVSGGLMDRFVTKVMGEKQTLAELNDIISVSDDAVEMGNVFRASRGEPPLTILDKELIFEEVSGEALTIADFNEIIAETADEGLRRNARRALLPGSPTEREFGLSNDDVVGFFQDRVDRLEADIKQLDIDIGRFSPSDRQLLVGRKIRLDKVKAIKNPVDNLDSIIRDTDELEELVAFSNKRRAARPSPATLEKSGNQIKALARRRTGTPQRQAIEESRRATREVRRALDEGRPDDARRLMRQLIERDRAPLDPTR